MRHARTMALAAIGLAAVPALPARAQDGPPPAGALGELRRSFTIGGSPVPPLVFRDMGDGNAADLKPMLVAVDAWAAIGSDRYSEEIRVHDGRVSQTAPAADGGRGTETETYRYLGATPDGLMALVTEDATSEGTYAPATLHVVDAVVRTAFDADGKVYDRVEVTVVAGYPLGDRWRGRATLAGDTVTVATEGGAPRPPNGTGDARTYRIARP